MTAKTAAEARQAWKTWYNYKNSKGEYPNKFKYLKKKLIKKINDGKDIKLTTLRSYGLLDFMKKNGNRRQKNKLKEDLDMENVIYSEPQQLVIPDFEYTAPSPYIQQTTVHPQQFQPSSQPEFEEPQYDEPVFDSVFDDVPEQAPTPTTTEEYQELPENLPTNKKAAAKKIKQTEKQLLQSVKLPKNFKYTVADAKKLFSTPNLISKSTLQPYPKKTLLSYESRLRTLVVKIMGCKDPKKDIKSCLGNPRSVIKRMMTVPNPKFKNKIGYSRNSIKEYINPIIVLGRQDPKFRKHLGEKTFDAYRDEMIKLMEEVKEGQQEMVQEKPEILWEDIKDAYDKEKKKYDALKQKVLKKGRKKRDLTADEKTFLTDFLLLATPYLAIPKRDDWSLKIVQRKPKLEDEKKQNFYVVANKLMILNSYKTARMYGRKEYLLQLDRTNRKFGNELGKILNESIKMWKREYIISKNDGSQYKNGVLSSRLAQAMKRIGLQDKNPNKKDGKPEPISYNNFRHSFVSWARGKNKNGKSRFTAEEKRKIATYDMLHSPQTQDIYDRIISRAMIDGK